MKFGTKPSHTSFQHWNIDTAGKAFGIRQRPALAALDNWLASRSPLGDEERREMLKYRRFLRAGVDYWNEQELQINFIGPIMLIVNFHQERYNVFYGRKLSAIVGGIRLHGTVDCVVATGRVEPIQPFFFLHEYKRQRGADADPLAQLLTAMIAARALNTEQTEPPAASDAASNTAPIYGCYVLGRFWFFVVLEGEEYAQSRAFDATEEEDLTSIVQCLHFVKAFIEERLGAAEE